MANQSVYSCYFLEAHAAYKGNRRMGTGLEPLLSKWEGVGNDKLSEHIFSKSFHIYRGEELFSTDLLEVYLED